MNRLARMAFAMVLLLGAPGAALGGSLDDLRNRPVDPWISDLAEAHVAATRAWARGDYEVWLIRKLQNHVEVWVIDLRQRGAATAAGTMPARETAGSGESFSLHLDPAARQVVRELAFQ